MVWEFGVAQTRQSKGEAFADLVFEIAASFFRLRAMGRKYGFISKRGAGTLGFMRTLKNDGPITVPDLARMRPTSRQRMQQLADELAEAGLIEFIDNPHHKTSRLMRLTRKGEARYRAMIEQLGTLGAEIAQGNDERELRAAAALMRTLRERLPSD
jgi:DNA-binding MarR family transcriptional regulator